MLQNGDRMTIHGKPGSSAGTGQGRWCEQSLTGRIWGRIAGETENFFGKLLDKLFEAKHNHQLMGGDGTPTRTARVKWICERNTHTGNQALAPQNTTNSITWLI